MLKIISVTYNHLHELEVSIGSFLLQTDPNWELLTVHDGIVPETVKTIESRYKDKRVKFTNTTKRNGKWGHINRKIYLSKIKPNKDDWVLLTNSDNYYCPEFVEQMMNVAKREKAGIVTCDCIHSHLHYRHHHSSLKIGGIDMGEFIVRADIAVKIGFNHTDFAADGMYAVECGKECEKQGLLMHHIPLALFVHN